jgi:hypothetical protein
MGIALGRTFAIGFAASYLFVASRLRADPHSDAHRHFTHGVELAETGKLQESIDEFERAYEISPRFAVLYNLGQAYGLAGRSVLAASTLRTYLKEGASNIDASRREQVESVIRYHEGRIGRLRVRTEPEGAFVQVDGKSLAPEQDQVVLLSGLHGVSARLHGYETSATSVDVPAGGVLDLVMHLSPTQPLARGWLTFDCVTPDVAVALDGTRVGKLPLPEPLVAKTGSHALRFLREGYSNSVKLVDVATAVVTTVDCGIVRSNLADNGGTAKLRIESSEPDTETFVDGVRFQGEPVAPGAHHVEVRRDGFERWTRTIYTPPRRITIVSATLRPTPSHLREYRREAVDRRTLAYVAGGTGIALGVVAVGLRGLSSSQYSSWRERALASELSLADGVPTPEERAEAIQLREDAVVIDRLDTAAVVVGVSGLGLAVLSAVLLFTGPEPQRYSSGSAAPNPRSLSWSF